MCEEKMLPIVRCENKVDDKENKANKANKKNTHSRTSITGMKLGTFLDVIACLSIAVIFVLLMKFVLVIVTIGLVTWGTSYYIYKKLQK